MWRTPGFWWFSILTAGVLAGLLAMVIVMVLGHTHEMNVGWEPPWGILVVAAHFLTLASAGICLVLPQLLPPDWELPSAVTQKGLMTAGVAFTAALGVAVIELSQPVRLSFSADLGESFLQGVYLSLVFSLVYLSCLAATCFNFSRSLRFRAKVTGFLAFVVAMVVLFKSAGMLSLFGHDAAWVSAALVPVAGFSAVTLGAALMLLIALIPFWLSGKEVDDKSVGLRRRLILSLRVLLSIQLLVEATALYGGAAWGGERIALVSQLLVFGPLSPGFWIGEVFLGLVLPFVLLFSRRNGLLVFAGLLVLAGQFMHWHDLLMATQLGEILTTSPLAMSGLVPRLVPCMPKFLITIGTLCLILLLLSLNEKLQPYRD